MDKSLFELIIEDSGKDIIEYFNSIKGIYTIEDTKLFVESYRKFIPMSNSEMTTEEMFIFLGKLLRN